VWVYAPCRSAPGSAESTLDSSAAERLARSVSWRGKHSPPRFWRRAWSRATWLRLLSGLTCDPSTLELGVARFRWSLLDTPASPSRSPASDSEPTTSGTCGPKSCGSSTTAEHRSCSARTSPDTWALGSPTSSPTLPRSGSMRSGTCSPRETWARRTSESGCSSWPTAKVSTGAYCYSSGDHSKPVLNLKGAARLWPTAQTHDASTPKSPAQIDAMRARSGAGVLNLNEAAKGWATPTLSMLAGFTRDPEKMARQREKHPKGHDGNELARQAETWATPRATDGEKGGPNQSFGAGGTPLPAQASTWRTPDLGGGSSLNGSGTKRNPLLAQQASLWATPTTRDWKSDDPNQSPEHSPPLGRQVLRTETAGSAGSETVVLNPSFVEALQGFPPGWTSCAPSATPSSRRSPRSRGKSSPLERSEADRG
jgi:hypothetical protein